MRTPYLALLILCASLPGLAQEAASTEAAELPHTTPLAITVAPAPVGKGQVPQFVTITLTNTTDRPVAFPMPSIGCNSSQGAVRLEVRPASEKAEGCTFAADSERPQSPAEQIAHWTVLQPGETGNYGVFLTPLLPEGKAAIEVRGFYTPPQVDSAVQEELYRQTLAYPTEALASVPVEIEREGK